MEVHEAGGGINFTVEVTKAASEDKLLGLKNLENNNFLYFYNVKTKIIPNLDNLQKNIYFIFYCIFFVFLFSQIKTPQTSPLSKLSQKVRLINDDIKYSRTLAR